MSFFTGFFFATTLITANYIIIKNFLDKSK